MLIMFSKFGITLFYLVTEKDSTISKTSFEIQKEIR